MKGIIFLILINTILFSKIVDFGIQGQMYDIEEENMNNIIKSKLAEIQSASNKKMIKKALKKKINAAAVGTTELPFGKEMKTYQEDNYQILERDIVNPYGRVFRKKGEKVLINTTKPLDICFIDGANKEILYNQIEYFDMVLAKKERECTYMVSNINVFKLNKKYAPRKFYPSKEIYEERFMIKSIPTYIHIDGYKKSFYSFPMKMFTNEGKMRWAK